MKWFYFQDCCDTLHVEQDEENDDLSKHHPQIFATYLKQNGSHEGRVNYLSSDGKNWIVYYKVALQKNNVDFDDDNKGR